MKRLIAILGLVVFCQVGFCRTAAYYKDGVWHEVDYHYTDDAIYYGGTLVRPAVIYDENKSHGYSYGGVFSLVDDGPILLTSPKGIQYWVSVPSAPGKYPIAFYAPGGGDRPENPQNSTFYKQFIPTNKEKFICIAIVMPPGKTGWDYPVDANGTTALAYMAKYTFDLYADQSNGKFHGGGWSAGASYNAWYQCRSFLTTLTICAGMGNMDVIKAFGQYKIPGRHYHGTSDDPINISKVRYAVAQYGPSMVLIEIPNGEHPSAPALAYSTTENIGLWYSSFNPPQEPQPIDDPVKKAYFRKEENKLIIETEGGLILKFTPD